MPLTKPRAVEKSRPTQAVAQWPLVTPALCAFRRCSSSPPGAPPQRDGLVRCVEGPGLPLLPVSQDDGLSQLCTAGAGVISELLCGKPQIRTFKIWLAFGKIKHNNPGYTFVISRANCFFTCLPFTDLIRYNQPFVKGLIFYGKTGLIRIEILRRGEKSTVDTAQVLYFQKKLPGTKIRKISTKCLE